MTTRRAPSRIIPRAFPGIKPDEIEELIANSQVHSYLPGVVLCRENAVEDRFYMILDGEAEVTKHINNTESRLLTTLAPGDFFGEMALIHNAPRAATVSAKTALTTLELDKAAFDRVIHKSTSIAMAMAPTTEPMFSSWCSSTMSSSESVSRATNSRSSTMLSSLPV